MNYNSICCCRTEKQTIIELPKAADHRILAKDEEKKREADTKDILQKIAEVNLNHGLTPKKIRYPPSYQIQYNNQQSKQLSNFQFASSPFTNPIFEYLHQNQLHNQKPHNFNTKSSFAEQNNDELPDGYTIKRKVTHQQTLIIPNVPYPQAPEQFYNKMYYQPQVNNQFDAAGRFPGQYGLVPINHQLNENYLPSHINYLQKPEIGSPGNKTEEELNQSKQNFLVNNIKNIIANSQAVPNLQSIPVLQVSQYPNTPEIFPATQNPYVMSFGNDPNAFTTNYYNNPYYSYIMSPVQPIPTQNPKFTDTYYANLQSEKDGPGHRQIEPTSRQMGGPFSQYFPIVIKNPFQQMFQAFTSMVEYGPAANLCRSHHGNLPVHVEGATHRSHSTTRAGKATNLQEAEAAVPVLDIKNEDKITEVSIEKIEETSNKTNDNNEFYIEGLKIFDANVSTKNKSVDPNLEQREMTEDDVDDVLVEEDKFFQKPVKYPSREEIPQTPSNGIFIQKLKVRKGGVAIAGPGGIATAGSGGTAIVGPNGYAYTQPNGVAIAGPGSRVISVDPEVNLSEFVQNVTRTGIINRLGKLVAVGPVIYHDLGQH